MVYSRFRKIIFSVHFFSMLGLLGLMFYPLTWPVKLPAEFWTKQVLITVIWAILFYLNMLVLVPKILNRQKSGLYVIAILLIMNLVVLINRWLDKVTDVNMAVARVFFHGQPHPKGDEYMSDKIAIFMGLIIFGLSSVIAYTNKLEADRQAFQEAEKEKISNELSFLKAQINPHFFFNILHTIYALTDTNTAAAKDSLYTLSHMMRYVLYDTKNDSTTLESEIKFVEDYIKLMKLRLSDNVQVIFEKQQGIKNYTVAPMLVLPFIENAFKHGISSIHPSYVFIEISERNNVLKIEVRNSLFEEASKDLEESNGIGIVNTKRRLDLLYPGKHTLLVEADKFAKEYTAVLTLNLNDH